MIIGLTGFIGSGKSTVANILVSKHGYRADSFAASLKDSLSVIFGWPRDMLEGDTPESRMWRNEPDLWWSSELGVPGFSPRYAMTHYGTDVIRRYFHQDIWLLTLKNRLRKYDNVPTVITDARFSNEVDFIKKLGGRFLNVRRGPLPVWYEVARRANLGDAAARQTMLDIYKDVHASEWEWIGLTGETEIDNNATLGELGRKVSSALEMIPVNGV